MFSTEDLKTAIGATVIARRNAAARLREAGNPRDPFRALPGMEQQIKAVVEWTPRGARYLENKEYRYLSPVVNVRKADNKAVGLHSLALTNTPAIEGMNPIVNSDNFEGGQHSMDIKKLAELLGLSEDATEEQVVEALKVCLAENRSLKEAEKQPPENVVANKLLVPVDLKKIKDLQQLLALLQEVEDYAAANEDGEPGDDEDAAPAPA